MLLISAYTKMIIMQKNILKKENKNMKTTESKEMRTEMTSADLKQP